MAALGEHVPSSQESERLGRALCDVDIGKHGPNHHSDNLNAIFLSLEIFLLENLANGKSKIINLDIIVVFSL